MRMQWFVHSSVLRFLSMVAHSAVLPGVSICPQFLYLGKRSKIFSSHFLAGFGTVCPALQRIGTQSLKKLRVAAFSTLAEDNRARVIPEIRSDLFGRFLVICWYA